MCLHKNRESDIPWPACYVDARTHSAVDMQYVDRAAFGAMPLGDAQCLIQVARHYNGNDIVWLLKGRDRGASLDDAKVMSCEKARELCMAEDVYVAWSKAYIDQHVRQVVSCTDVNREEALRGTGIKLVKPRRPRKGSSQMPRLRPVPFPVSGLQGRLPQLRGVQPPVMTPGRRRPCCRRPFLPSNPDAALSPESPPASRQYLACCFTDLGHSDRNTGDRPYIHNNAGPAG